MTTPPPSPSPRPHRLLRRFRARWTSIPLLLALAYAVVRLVVGSSPPLEAMVPADAILVRRWKNFDTYDRERGDPADAGQAVAAASAVLGADSNLPDLPGIDRSRPLVEALLPLGIAEPRLFVLPVSDASRVRATYRDPGLKERHARHLEIHGAWAASSRDRATVRDAGTFASPLPPSEGEDWYLWANWPAFVDYASRPDQMTSEPFASAFRALGFDPATMMTGATDDGRGVLTVTHTGRVPIVRGAWSRVTVRSFPGRIVVDLDPADDAKELRDVIAAVKPDPDDDREVAMPSPLEASLHVRGRQGRRLLVYALGYAGLRWPEASAKGEFAALKLDAPGGWSVWAEMADTPTSAWVVSLAARKSAFPDLATLGTIEASDAGPVAFVAGSAAVTALYGGVADRSTFLPIPSAADPDLLVTAIGPKADVARAKLQSTISTRPRSTPGDTPGRVEVATFAISKVPLARLLGSAAFGPRGLFATLAERSVRGRMLVIDGARLRIELEATEK